MTQENEQLELQRLVTALIDQQITDEQHARLVELLQDPEARAYYLRQIDMHARLQWKIAAPSISIAPSLPGEPVVEAQEDEPPRTLRFPMWVPLAAAACLAIGFIFWAVTQQSGVVDPGDPGNPEAQLALTSKPVTLESGWHIKPVGEVAMKVIDNSRIRLDHGELFVESTESTTPSDLTIETAAGSAHATGTKFYVGTHTPGIPGGTQTTDTTETFGSKETGKGNDMNLKKVTRVLVLSGVVTLANSHGTVEGKANELLAAKKGNSPTKLTIQSNSDFAYDMYHQFAKEKDSIGKNMFFSPYSISSALAMATEGARGKTAEEMGSVLRFPKQARRLGKDAQMIPWQTSQIHTGMGALNERFNRKDKPYALNIANAMWCEQTFPLRQQYIDALNEPYGAAVKPATFKTNPEGERKRINEWVEQQTNNRIKELLAPGLVDSLTRLVLTNAIFFKGDWAVKFKEKQTRDMPFTLADGGKPKVKMMMHTATAKREGAKKGEAPFRYAAFNAKGAPVKGFRDKVSFEVLELPYKGDELSMIVMLPQANGLAKLEKMLSADRVNQWIGNLKRQKVFVMLPRFKMETGYAMNKSLKAMGMPRAFRPLGEFTGLSDSPEAREIYITAVVHKAFVEVNEEGTEAAAATAVVFGGRSAGPRYPSFRADRPFVFMIRDNATGSVLFLGRLMDPTTDE